MNHLKFTVGCVLATAVLTAPGWRTAVAQSSDAGQVQTTPAPERRIPQQKTPTTGVLQGVLLDENGRPVPGVDVKLVAAGQVAAPETISEGDGVFRLREVPSGTYDLLLTPTAGGVAFKRSGIHISAGDVVS